ncbi:UbiA family prenyltransferase [Streptomyces sp. NPDC006140]|uniref:UbiA family prenyltransferase n=1 Tax=Streptomyces sp. NPDC006140 TaxID=3154579 RepID=UPI0033CF0B30
MVSTIICRWEITVMIVLQALALYLFGEWAVDASPAVSDVIAVGLFGLFAQGFCSVLNDINDVEADRINHPERPFPSGRVSIAQGWAVVASCFAGSVLCALALAPPAFGAVMFALHLLFSLLYSFPGVRFGRQWLLGPLTLVTSTVCGVLAVLSCTSLYASAGAGKGVILLVGLVCFLHHLFVIPLKDIKDLAGDAHVGGSSLAMKIPTRGVHAIGVAGYTVPWIVLYAGVGLLDGGGDIPGLGTPLRTLAVLCLGIGAVMSWLVAFRPVLLVRSQRFCWFAELGLLFLFQLFLPVVVRVVRG